MCDDHCSPLVHGQGALADGRVGEAAHDEDGVYAGAHELGDICVERGKQAIVHINEGFDWELISLTVKDAGVQGARRRADKLAIWRSGGVKPDHVNVLLVPVPEQDVHKILFCHGLDCTAKRFPA